MAIGEKLARIITEKNRNVNDLATATGVNAQTIYSIIKRNNTKADLDDLFLLCDELGVSIDEFRSEDIFPKKKAPAQVQGLTPEEWEIVQAYRAASQDQVGQALIRGIVAYIGQAAQLASHRSVEEDVKAVLGDLEAYTHSQERIREGTE